MKRHVHIWEIDADGRGANYYEANEMAPDGGVIDHDIDETLSLNDVVALFPGVRLTIHMADGWYARHAEADPERDPEVAAMRMTRTTDTQRDQ